jgi:putative ABC transport system permease protein
VIDTQWREAMQELARRKLRTGLTLLGLVFGVGAIVAMQAVGEGSRREALRLVEGLGLNNVIAEAIPQDEETLREVRQRSLGLTLADAHAAAAVVPGAKLFTAEKVIRTHSIFSEHAASDAGASGVTPDYFRLSSLALADGRGLNEDDEAAARAVAVLGGQAARALFPRGGAVGQEIKVNHVWLEVVGVLADRDVGAENFEGVQLANESNHVFITFNAAQLRFRFQPRESEVDRLVLQLDRPERLESGARVLAAMLSQRHAGVQDYSLIVPLRLYRQHQQTQRIFRVVMGAIAGVSLIVGGIGIMNIMLANVLERRREIGLLRALGARRNDVVRQFLREAALICICGASFGLIFGIALAYLIALFAGWQVAWSPLPVLLSANVCALVGLCFGVYPANQAAQLDPIAALRTE